MITEGLRDEGFPGTYSMASFNEAFSVLHESMGMSSSDGEPLLAVACSHKAMIMGMANALILSPEQHEQFVNSLKKRSICEQLIIRSALAAKQASTTGELMVSSLIRGCAIRYKNSPGELEFFSKYFQEAEDECGYSVQTPISVWIRDADLFSRAVCRMKPSIGNDLINRLNPDDVQASRDLCQELSIKTTGKDSVVFCNHHWKENLGHGEFYRRSPAYIDQIITMVDLIVWRNILAENAF
jgi:hypothetical protein